MKMNLFEGKSPAERNKIIAAGVLGLLALTSLWFAFGGSFFGGSKTTVTVSTPTPKPGVSATRELEEVKMPSKAEQNFAYESTAISYRPGNFYAPDPGRNIFAFYEPPPPTPYSPTPAVIVTPPPPTPTPTPPYLASFVTPQSVYAGSKSFRLEVSGDKFDADSRIFFNNNELPTSFVNPQRLNAMIPANLIAGEGTAQVIIRSPDGVKYSLPQMVSIQAPPKPQFQYIGMIARKRANNDTAYLMEQGKQTPTGIRLNDVVSGRFRLVSISSEETVFEDVNLGFRHRVVLFRPPAGTASTSGPPVRGGFPSESYQPYNPSFPPPNTAPQSIPGIPDSIPRYVPPANANSNRPQPKKDVDDEDEDGDN
jgi:hypothetical protein